MSSENRNRALKPATEERPSAHSEFVRLSVWLLFTILEPALAHARLFLLHAVADAESQTRRLIPWLLRVAIRRGILQWLLVEKIQVPKISSRFSSG